jgi:hypothetical protein
VNVFLGVTRPGTSGGEVGGYLGPDDFCEAGIDLGLQLPIAELLDHFLAMEFSMPLAQRALQQIMIVCH